MAERILSQAFYSDGRPDHSPIELRIGDEVEQTTIDGNSVSLEISLRGDIIIRDLRLGLNSRISIGEETFTRESIQDLRGRRITPEERSLKLIGPSVTEVISWS